MLRLESVVPKIILGLVLQTQWDLLISHEKIFTNNMYSKIIAIYIYTNITLSNRNIFLNLYVLL